MKTNTCIKCGSTIPEGKDLCPVCEKKHSTVNHPSYYADGKIEVIDYIEDKQLGFCLGNAVKYISRAGKKDPTKEVEDLKKALWYIKRRIKEVKSQAILGPNCKYGDRCSAGSGTKGNAGRKLQAYAVYTSDR